jgi:thiamine biosynthesis protein ThiC
MKTVAAIALVASALAGCEPSPEDRARQVSQGAIRLCWEQQARKSLDPDTARFVAGTCERMEGDFRGKYNRNP